jgi:hypothetical protein
MSEVSVCTLHFESDYEFFAGEAATNPLQLNSKLELLDDDADNVRWTGFVSSKNLSEDDEKILSINCLDPSAKLSKSLVYVDGDYTFTQTSPAVVLTDESLLRVEMNGDAAYWYYPNKDAANWLPVTGTGETNNTLADGASSGALQLTATIDHNGMLPRGLIYIHTATPEIASYDGYYDTGAGGKYLFDNVKRGQLGTSAQTIPAGTKISQFLSMLMHPAHGVIVDGHKVHTPNPWEGLGTELYTIQPNEGAVTFSFNPLDLVDDDNVPDLMYSEFRISMGVFDELSVDTVDLETTLTAAIRTQQTKGGAGSFYPLLVDIGDIKLTRVYQREPLTARDFMDKILNDTTLLTGKLTDPIGWWYDHYNGYLAIKALAQKLIPDITFTSYESVEQDVALEDIYSACLVQYNLGLDYNLCAPTRYWRPVVGDTVGSVNCEFVWKYSLEKGKWTRNDTETTNHQYGWKDILDRNETTGTGVGLDGYSATADMFFFWFDDAAADYVIDTIECLMSFEEVIDTAFSCDILGITSFNIANPPASTGFIPLSASCHIEFDPGTEVQGSKGQSSVKLTAEKVGVKCQGIVIRYTGASARTEHAAWKWGLLKEIRLTGFQDKSVLVKISDTPLDARDVYAPLSYAKLVAALPGLDQHRSRIVKIGTATYNMAVSLGRLLVQDTLVLSQIHTYRVTSNIQIPTIGDTVRMGADGFEGVCIMFDHSANNGGEETLTVDLYNINSPIV